VVGSGVGVESKVKKSSNGRPARDGTEKFSNPPVTVPPPLSCCKNATTEAEVTERVDFDGIAGVASHRSDRFVAPVESIGVHAAGLMRVSHRLCLLVPPVVDFYRRLCQEKKL